jgi:hypothetical protein
MQISSFGDRTRRNWKHDVPFHVAGALLGGSLTGLTLGIAAWFGLAWPTLPHIDVSGLATGIGAGLGLLSGPSAATSIRPVGFALAMAARAVVFGLTLSIGGAAIVARLAEQPGFDAWSFLGLMLVGVPVAMVLGLPVTSFVALTATGILRLAARRPVIGSLVIAAITGGMLVGLPALASSRFVLPVSVSPGDGVRLTVTIENHSTQNLTLGVWAASGDSTGGWTTGIQPCFVTSESSDETPGWFVTIQPDTGDPLAWETIPEPLISAAEAPGSHPEIGVLVAADGAISVFPQRAPPTDEELTVDLCAGRAS